MNSQRPFGMVTAPHTIRFERLLPGPVERVWSYLADSDKRGQWLASGAMPPAVGGAFEMRFHHADLSDDAAPVPERYKHLEGGHVSAHRVLAFDAPRKLAITWSDGAGGESEVSFELIPEGDMVRLVLVHKTLANAEVLRSVGKGWHTHLEVLAEKLNGRSTRSFWTEMAEIADHYDKAIEDA
jgi:uncharacterized protein YndB with AHSA1/START domain